MEDHDEYFFGEYSIKFLAKHNDSFCYLVNKNKMYHGFVNLKDGLWVYRIPKEDIKIYKKPESNSILPPRSWLKEIFI